MITQDYSQHITRQIAMQMPDSNHCQTQNASDAQQPSATGRVSSFSNTSLRQIAMALGAVIFLYTTTTFADEKAEAKKHFQAGVALQKTDDFAGAAAEFELSLKLYATKGGLFNLAYCYKALHRYSDALDSFRRLLVEHAGKLAPEMKAAAEQQIEEINALVARVKIDVNMDDAEIRIDDQPAGRSPLSEPLLLGPGEHEITVELDGYEAIKQTVNTTAGKELNEKFHLVEVKVELTIHANTDGAAVFVDSKHIGETPLEEPARVTGGKHLIRVTKDGFEPVEQTVDYAAGEKASVSLNLVKSTLASATAESTNEEPVGSSEQPQDERKLSAGFWVTMAGALALGGTAGTFLGLTISRDGDLKNYNDNISNTTGQDQLDWRAKAEKASDDVNLYQYLALGFGIGAGALAVTSLVIMGVNLRDDSDENTARITPSPGGLTIHF